MDRICRSLCDEGFSITLVGRKTRGTGIPTRKPFRQITLNCFFRKGKWMYLEFNIRLFFFLILQKADAIVAIDLDTILPCYYVSAIRKIPRVYDAHELFTELKEVVTRPSIQKIWLSIEKRMVPKFPSGYTVSSSIAEEFNRRYGVHYDVIMNVPLLQQHKEYIKTSGKYFLYQGAVNEGRGLEWLIPAMKEVDAELWICGEGNFSDQCRELIRAAGLERKVMMKGMMETQELCHVTRQAYAGINLVEPLGLNQIYSLANKFFDYIHAGIPQLTMDFPEYRKINQKYETAILISTLNSDIIAAALNNLLQNEVLYRRLLSNCRGAAEEFNWQHEENKLRSFYNKIFN
jgi:glycosyltransferase involved in cell wall biosynthesis